LVSKEAAEADRYDVVIDAKSRCGDLRLNAGRIIDLRMLDGGSRA